ncbi:MAG: adaptor protein MecA [Clostridia bacterium]|nr:adaptor protein MecA [Clostridia bacterium]
MKFEKLNENKIRITLNNQDLVDKNIDFHSFMSNSQESQSLFLAMLDEAEKKVGFVTKDYKLRIEALAMSDGNFILTITRFGKNVDTNAKFSKAKNLKIKRKNLDMSSKQLIYKFDTFDDFCNFSNFISKLDNFYNIAKSMVLYSYRDSYYLCLTGINVEHNSIKQLYTLITEFGTYVDNSEIFGRKLIECR